MVPELLYQQSEVLIAIALLGIMVLGAELGYRFGRRGRQRHNELTRTQIISLQAATLGLLALLLGFTFAMALSRFEYRKQMVVQESNAIGTAVLRSQFLPISRDDEVNKLFRRYVEIRLQSVLLTGQVLQIESSWTSKSGKSSIGCGALRMKPQRQIHDRSHWACSLMR